MATVNIQSGNNGQEASLSLMLAVTVPKMMHRAGFMELFFRSAGEKLRELADGLFSSMAQELGSRAFNQEIAQEEVASRRAIRKKKKDTWHGGHFTWHSVWAPCAERRIAS